MEEEVKKNSGQNLGIAALITAIVTFVLAAIPCVGIIAIIPGIIAVVLASVGLSQASRNNSPRGILIASLAIAVVACMISFSQIFVAGKIAQKADKWPGKIEEIVNDVQNDVLKDLEDANVSIRIQSGDEKVEINTNTKKEDRVQTLEDLEGDKKSENDSATVTISIGR